MSRSGKKLDKIKVNECVMCHKKLRNTHTRRMVEIRNSFLARHGKALTDRKTMISKKVQSITVYMGFNAMRESTEAISEC